MFLGLVYIVSIPPPEILSRYVTVFFQQLFDRVIHTRVIIAVVPYSLGRTYDPIVLRLNLT